MAAGKDFDGKLFAKLVALLDSPTEAEAAGALHRLRLLIKKGGMNFYEAVETRDYKTAIWESFGEPECLNWYFEGSQAAEELAKERELRLEAERAGAEITRAFTAENETLRAEVGDLKAALASAKVTNTTTNGGIAQAWPWWRLVIGATGLVLLVMAMFR